MFPKNKPLRDKKLYMSYIREFCEACGLLANARHHIKFRSQGGSDEHSNLICLCGVCHNKAHGVDSKKYREKFLQIKASYE
jgi:5-methylcytosine-specific restriction endonuclease McrA